MYIAQSPDLVSCYDATRNWALATEPLRILRNGDADADDITGASPGRIQELMQDMAQRVTLPMRRERAFPPLIRF